MTCIDSVADRVIVEQRATRTVNNDRAVRHLCYLLSANQATRLRSGTSMERDNARTRQQFLQLNLLCQTRQRLRCNIRIIDQDVSAKGFEDTSHAHANCS